MNLLPYLKKLFVISCFFVSVLHCETSHPFDYDLHLVSHPGNNERVMIIFHGMGADYRFAKVIQDISMLSDQFIGFNFTDHEIMKQLNEPENTIYGTPRDLLPAVYVLKKTIVDEGKENVNLYGYSMGGAVLVNTLVALHTNKYDSYLQKINVSQEDKVKILEVLRKGYVLLDTPLKSMREVVEKRGANRWTNPIAARFAENDMEPIDSLKDLEGIGLHFFVHFQKNDEYFSNRDDALYIDLLKAHNKNGSVIVTSNGDEGHSQPHHSLWYHYHTQLKKTYHIHKEGQKLVIGKKIRTSNQTLVTDASALWAELFDGSLCSEIPNRVNGAALIVYSNYDSNYKGSYDYLLGCEVSSLSQIPKGMVGFKIPKGNYALFKTEGLFPDSMMKVWKKIWGSPMKRSYDVDYELYPEDFHATQNPHVEIHISAKG